MAVDAHIPIAAAVIKDTRKTGEIRLYKPLD